MNKWIRILLVGSYIWYLGEGLLGPLYAIFAEKVGGDILDITGAYAVYLITSGLIAIYIGKISDKISKEKIMIFGYALNALATFGYLLVDTPAKLFLVQGVLGIASALATPTWDALFAKHTDKKSDGEEWGLSDGGPDVVTGIALIIGGFIVTYQGFTILFVTMGTIQVISCIIQSFILFNKK